MIASFKNFQTNHRRLALAVALFIPFSPFGGWFGFETPSAAVNLTLAGIVVIYLLCAELAKPYAILGALTVKRRWTGA